MERIFKKGHVPTKRVYGWLTFLIVFVLLGIGFVFVGCSGVKKVDYVTTDDIAKAKKMLFDLIEVYLPAQNVDAIVNMYPPESRTEMRPQIESYFNTWKNAVMSASNVNKPPEIISMKIVSADRYAVSDQNDPTAKFKIPFKVVYTGLYRFWLPKEEKYVKYECKHSAWIEFVKYKGEVYLLKFQSLDTPACEKKAGE